MLKAYKAIIFLQKTLIKPLNSYGLFYNVFSYSVKILVEFVFTGKNNDKIMRYDFTIGKVNSVKWK